MVLVVLPGHDRGISSRHQAGGVDDGGAWRCGEGVTRVAYGDFAVAVTADAGLLSLDKGQPGALRGGRRLLRASCGE